MIRENEVQSVIKFGVIHILDQKNTKNMKQIENINEAHKYNESIK